MNDQRTRNSRERGGQEVELAWKPWKPWKPWIHVFKTQRSIMNEFILNRHLRTPMVIVWFSNFGSSVAAAVITYFYKDLGLGTVQIGQVGAIGAVGSIFVAPVYGWIFDTRGAWFSIAVSSSLCGFGCLLRGLAQGRAECMISASIMAGASFPMIKHLINRTDSHTFLSALPIETYSPDS